ncbi:MAG: hypothetical protein K1Y36_08610, partial [Blastocatellia bacterium]|nr:hypothetical protein [Blastocatellia bacterium]
CDDHVHEFFRQGQHRISFAKGFPKLILPDSFFQRSKMAKVELKEFIKNSAWKPRPSGRGGNAASLVWVVVFAALEYTATYGRTNTYGQLQAHSDSCPGGYLEWHAVPLCRVLQLDE